MFGRNTLVYVGWKKRVSPTGTADPSRRRHMCAYRWSMCDARRACMRRVQRDVLDEHFVSPRRGRDSWGGVFLSNALNSD